MGEARLRPFPVNPEIMARIRPMQPADASRVAALHRAAMGSSLWARLGEPFLEALYRALLLRPEFLGFVYCEEGQVRGFVAGTTDSAGLLLRTLVHSWHRLLGPLLAGILRQPSVLWPLLSTPLYFRRSRPHRELQGVRAESLFCSFEPELRGKRISGHINKVLFDELRVRGHRAVKITTEADNRGAVRQLLSWGFEERGEFRFYGKRMKAWLLKLEGHPRLGGKEL